MNVHFGRHLCGGLVGCWFVVRGVVNSWESVVVTPRRLHAAHGCTPGRYIEITIETMDRTSWPEYLFRCVYIISLKELNGS